MIKNRIERERTLRNDLGVTLSNLEKIMTDPPRWNIKVNGRDLLFLRTTNLLNQRRFGELCLTRLSVLPNLIDDREWKDLLRDLLNNVTEIPASKMKRKKKGK